MKGFVFVSRYTPGLIDGTDVDFSKGEIVKAKSFKTGDIKDFVIDSDYCSNKIVEPGKILYGYVGYLLGDESKSPMFVAEDQIVDWEGRNRLFQKTVIYRYL